MNTKKLFFDILTFVLAVVLLLSLSTCKKEEKNSSPSINEIQVIPNGTIPSGQHVQLTVIATDPDQDPLTYNWSADEGSFVGDIEKSVVIWQPPIKTFNDIYNVSVTVSDGKATASSNKSINVAATIVGIGVMPPTLDFGNDQVEMSVKIYNTENGSLTWETIEENASWLTLTPSSGTINTNQDTANVLLKVDRGSLLPNTYTETFYFRDKNNTNTKVQMQVKMQVATMSSLKGFAYYAGTTIPVPGVLVSINGKSSTTGTNGYYEITDIASGTYTLRASKDGYDTYSLTKTLAAGTNDQNIEMTSALYTHNLFGTITNQVGDLVPLAVVVVLNPDGSESNLRTTSSSNGYYQIPTVPQGERTVRVTKENCKIFEASIFMSNSNYQFDIQIHEYGCLGILTVTDPRDGQVYPTIQIGNQCWLQKNLNIGTMINSSQNQTNNEIIEKYCYNDIELNCNIYGGLYHWDEAMQYLTTAGVQGICPAGWHLPTDAEWTALTTFLGGESVAGGKLKETGTTHWASPNTGATNESGFTALPAGGRGIHFNSLGLWTFFWSSTEYSSTISWSWYLYYSDTGVYRYSFFNSLGFSVRCLRD